MELIKKLLGFVGLLDFMRKVSSRISLNNINLERLLLLQSEIIARTKKKEHISVAFFLYFSSTWKFDRIYFLMENDVRFKPVVIVIPVVLWGKKNMLIEMEKTYNWFKNRNYNVVKAYNKNNNRYLDVAKEFSPDVVFYSEPYGNATKKQYRIKNWYKKSLAVYAVYGFNITNFTEALYNSIFHNLLWKNFVETPGVERLIQHHAYNKGGNVVVAGAPACDAFLDKCYKPKDAWHGTKLKRVIWAPHYYMLDQSGWANFSSNHQYMLYLADKYRDKICFAFKPHPYLKATLYNHSDWGKQRTDDYYERWSSLVNGQLEMDGYVDLFLTSDALMHDSGSFAMEYLFTKKPILFLCKNKNIYSLWNKMALSALDVSYKGYNQADVEWFIEDVVLNKQDARREDRLHFLNNALLLPGRRSASLNIVNYLKKELSK